MGMHTMKLELILISAIVIGCVAQNEPGQKPVGDSQGALIIAYSADSADTFTASRPDSVIALDWLREITSTHQIVFEAKKYPYGTLVERIGHRKNGDSGYWLYKVNGQMVPKSSDAHRVAWSDTLTFFFDER